MSEVLPVIFFGHGNPMNAVQNNRYTQGWQGIGKQIRKPKAILSISAHGLCQEPGSPSVRRQRRFTISRSSRELYQVQYPAPGDPDLARRVQQLRRHEQPDARKPKSFARRTIKTGTA